MQNKVEVRPNVDTVRGATHGSCREHCYNYIKGEQYAWVELPCGISYDEEATILGYIRSHLDNHCELNPLVETVEEADVQRIVNLSIREYRDGQ